MRKQIIEYNETYKDVLSEMIYKLYIEDPEGESMDDTKIAATIEYAKAHHDCLRIYMIMDEDNLSSANYDSNQPIGYAIVQLIWSNEWGGLTANIDEMYIVQKARGIGAGSDFIEKISEIIPEINRITLEVTPSNESALKLYERLGFKLAENTMMEKIIRSRKGTK